MAESQAAHLSPETVLAEMKKHGVTHIVWLPDSETNFLYVLMKAEPSLTLVAVAREGLAFSTAAGLATGGKVPIILIQNTGLMESGDSLRGWGLGLNIPVVMMVGYRGWTRHGVTTDTAAVYTERFLNAFDNIESFAINVERILAKPGPVFVALKITPEVNNTPIGQRRKWQTRKPVEALRDLQQELGSGS